MEKKTKRTQKGGRDPKVKTKGEVEEQQQQRGGGGIFWFLPVWVQFLVYVFLVIALQGLYTWLQELLFQVEKFPHRWYATLWQGILYSFFSFLVRKSAGDKGRKGPFRSYAFLSSMVFLGRFMGVACLSYIDFTTKILFQSSKLIPAMLVGIFYLGKRYTFAEYVAVLMLVAGLCLFSIGDSFITPTFSILGILLSSGDALTDAFKSNIQEHIMTKYGASTLEVALYTNLFACILALPVLFVNGELIAVVNNFDLNAHFSLVILYAVGYLASLCVLQVLRLSDALVSATVTCTRKVLSIIFSFLVFSKTSTNNHVIGGTIFFAGLALQIFLKHSAKKANPKPSKKHAE